MPRVKIYHWTNTSLRQMKQIKNVNSAIELFMWNISVNLYLIQRCLNLFSDWLSIWRLLLHFPPLRSAPSFSTPVFSTPAILPVSHFPLLHFQSPLDIPLTFSSWENSPGHFPREKFPRPPPLPDISSPAVYPGQLLQNASWTLLLFFTQLPARTRDVFRISRTNNCFSLKFHSFFINLRFGCVR